jgi:hypothetical protein
MDHGGLMASVVLNEPSIIARSCAGDFPFPDAALGQKRLL